MKSLRPTRDSPCMPTQSSVARTTRRSWRASQLPNQPFSPQQPLVQVPTPRVHGPHRRIINRDTPGERLGGRRRPQIRTAGRGRPSLSSPKPGNDVQRLCVPDCHTPGRGSGGRGRPQIRKAGPGRSSVSSPRPGKDMQMLRVLVCGPRSAWVGGLRDRRGQPAG